MITLATLPQSTPQQVFNQVKRHLLKQNEVCIDEKDVCSYRSGKLKCAAGCLMSDEEYKPEFESTDWDGLIQSYKITRCHRELITDLQSIHDSESPENWKTQLKEVANKYQLKWK